MSDRLECGEDEALEHFAQMESAYSVMLGSLGLRKYRRLPLSKLFYNAYLDLHPRRELAVVDLVEFLGGFFLLDSQGCHNPEAASRVVGAIGTSQEAPTLKELLTRLSEECRTGQSAHSTLKLIRLALWVAEDTASPKKRQALYQAISTALGVQSRGLERVFEDIAISSSFYSPLSSGSARNLRELSHLIRDSLEGGHVVVKVTPPKKGEPLPKDFWNSLRELVDIAERCLSENRKSSLVEMLGRFRSTAAGELVKNLSSPTDHLLERVEQYVCPLVDSSRGRPRNNQAQRRMRLKKGTKHLYDIGHFLPHSAGGPKDINLFVQERSLNRGWSEQGKRYRWLENMVFSHPGTFFFVRPVYGDLSPIPRYLEWGALLDDALITKLSIDIERMPNLHLVSPGNKNRSRSKLSWLISVFENFKAEAIRDLMDSAEG
jgi:hypothetical protein